MEKPKILVVDDDKMNIRIAERMLGEDYRVTGALSGAEALGLIRQEDFLLILLDLHMPEMDGFAVLNEIKQLPSKADTPVIFLTADTDADVEAKCIEQGAFDFIRKPFIPAVARLRVERSVEHRLRHIIMAEEVKNKTLELSKRSEELEEMSNAIAKTLARAIDARDSYTNGHSWRVADYSVILASEMGWSDSEVSQLRYAALLHDVGKIGVPDQVLNKQDGLEDTETDINKSHTVMGSEILKKLDSIRYAREVARHHHERFDGLGYPDGLKGEDIPLSARIVGIVDAYDAMSTNRIYRKSLPVEVIRAELEKGRGTQFDPEILDVFLSLLDSGRLVNKEQKPEINSRVGVDIDNFAFVLNRDKSILGRLHRFGYIYDRLHYFLETEDSKCSLMVFDLVNDYDAVVDADELEKAMKAMEYGIESNLQSTDISKRIGPASIMVLLFDKQSENAGILADKFLASFYRNSFSPDFRPVYKIADLSNVSSGTGRRKILVVDDNTMNLRIAEHALKEKYDILKASSGKVALEVLPESGVELVLLDILMPELGGFETYERIRRMKGFETLPICFLTADTEEDSVSHMRSLGAPYVRKPFEAEELQRVVEMLLE